jgi:repressor LexA
MPVTKRQKEVLDFISAYVQDRGYSPSYEEMAEGLDLASVATVHKHVSALEAKEYLKRAPNMSRSLEVTTKWIHEQNLRSGSVVSMPHREPQPAIEVPLLGRIAAGTPVEAVAGSETLNFADFTGDPGTYALQVRGDSMIEDHICDGDFVLIQKTDRVRNSDIVVALVDGMETTLKRYYDEGDRIRLQPANSTMDPIFVHRQNLEIQGRLLAVLRKYR